MDMKMDEIWDDKYFEAQNGTIPRYIVDCTIW